MGFGKLPALFVPIDEPIAMSRAPQYTAATPGRWLQTGIVILCLGLPGCAKWNVRGEPFQEDDFSTLPKRMRPIEAGSETWGASNKAIQIERNLGFR